MVTVKGIIQTPKCVRRCIATIKRKLEDYVKLAIAKAVHSDSSSTFIVYRVEENIMLLIPEADVKDKVNIPYT